jgi:hypothetical protein
MDEMTGESPSLILNYQTPGEGWRPPRRLVPIPEALVHITWGSALPIICFIFSAKDYPALNRPWQSGQLAVYLGLIPRAICAWPFYPLLLYSTVSLLVTVIKPPAAIGRFVVRLGVYSGVILALQFGIIQWVCMGEDPLLACIGFGGAIFLAGTYELIRWLSRRFVRPMRLVALVLCVLLAWLVLWLMVAGKGHLIFAPVFFVLAAAPMLTLASYLTLSRLLWSNADGPGLGWLWAVWSGAYSAAWSLSIISVLDEYAKLPKSAPGGCYVVTAAAGGHQRLVKSTFIRRADGSIGINSTQIRRLKFAEIALASMCPGAHAHLRSAYDRLGPGMAQRIRSRRWMCDVAYCSLKPLEWIVVLIVRLKLRNEPQLAKQVLE